jgi:hypothetical protein
MNNKTSKAVEADLPEVIEDSPTRCGHGKLRNCHECLIEQLADLRSLMLQPEAKDLMPVEIYNALMRAMRVATDNLTKMEEKTSDGVSCLQTPTRNRFQ